MVVLVVEMLPTKKVQKGEMEAAHQILVLHQPPACVEEVDEMLMRNITLKVAVGVITRVVLLILWCSAATPTSPKPSSTPTISAL